MEHSERRPRSLEETVVRDMMPDSEHAHLSSDGNALLAAVRAELKAFKKEMKEVIKQEVKIQQQHAPAAGGSGKGQAVTIAQEALTLARPNLLKQKSRALVRESSAVSAFKPKRAPTFAADEAATDQGAEQGQQGGGRRKASKETMLKRGSVMLGGAVKLIDKVSDSVQEVFDDAKDAINETPEDWRVEAVQEEWIPDDNAEAMLKAVGYRFIVSESHWLRQLWDLLSRKGPRPAFRFALKQRQTEARILCVCHGCQSIFN